MEILCKAWKWARDQGHFDVHDRRYYLTPVDIKNICQRYKMDKRIHQNDAVAVHELCTQILKEEIIFYQELKEGVQPLVIIYQNEAQRMMKLAENVVFLDATYKGLTAYGYSFYALVARDEQQGRGTPLSYCISSDDTGEVLKIFLRSLKTTAENHGFDFCPRWNTTVGRKYNKFGIHQEDEKEERRSVLEIRASNRGDTPSPRLKYRRLHASHPSVTPVKKDLLELFGSPKKLLSPLPPTPKKRKLNASTEKKDSCHLTLPDKKAAEESMDHENEDKVK
ncbi:unnamed protein product [Mytilus edulis]|uniref:MULE transposase domain-containing protein n=1 Tax=Mytilus edulis TaxID=6550 RepID=A0A8S3U001_MYTED|nr:unnamed protein product [Mytilus edulis]